MDAELEAAKAFKQIEKLKKKHEKEISTLNEQLAEARLPKEAIRPTYDDKLLAEEARLPNEAAIRPTYDDDDNYVMPKYDETKEPHSFNGQFDGELAKLAEPSWFSGYDRCNI